MQLIVSAHQNGQAIAFQQITPAAAMEKARRMQEGGLHDVHITDITGRSYAPKEFAACFTPTTS
ncbi:hypothetical protein [Methylobacterium oxalidis]|uniref:Uncharacterized protein n=1 Tax=Methylobacterium oxalidis TaxID=944322 RepID=A0A512JD82_9HYPH|nr:hypothetical protein [Methylobacterium oxalidis]GEP07913.1 hypothetical protein MOX02_59510 [Methylobacterium oxalidis]GJE34478.1 hypothetical protein LDDCCGHA_4689 [Methylobacterium oxalidis]GLS67073.1 hypothetical protein GCM10007888_54560 [Methylobacterium oxalidis]